MKLKFIQTHKVDQHDGKGPVYEAGKVYDFPANMVGDSYAKKYIRRGYAVEVTGAEYYARAAADAAMAAVSSVPREPEPAKVEPKPEPKPESKPVEKRGRGRHRR